jgi:hypothetical protein
MTIFRMILPIILIFLIFACLFRLNMIKGSQSRNFTLIILCLRALKNLTENNNKVLGLFVN